MALEVPGEAIRALVASLSGVHDSRVLWSGDPEKSLGPIGGKAGKITLDVVARATNGRLEPRREFVAAPAPGTMNEEWGAHRILTISIRADAFIGHGQAFDVLEKVRFNLERPSARETLRAADLSFVDVPSIVSLDYKVDTRAVSAASMDLRLMHVASTDPEAVPWIEKVTKKTAAQVQALTQEEIDALPVVDLGFTKAP